MMTSLSRNDFYEAKREYDLLLKKVNIDIKKELCKLFTLTDSNNHQSDNIDFNHNFYYQVVDADNKTVYLESPLADLMVMHHFLHADNMADKQNQDGGSGK